MKKMRKPLAAILIAAAAISVTACAQTGTAALPNSITVDNKADSTIQVESTEAIKVAPDMAEINFAVSTQAEDPKACQEQNSEDLNQVITFLKNSGIDEKSIQTSNYGLQPIYDWNSGQSITGYEMRTSLIVSDLPIEQAGTLITSCIDAGINNIDHVSYLSSKYDETYQEALKKAIESSKAKAEVIAEAVNLTLGEIVNIDEINTYSDTRYTDYSYSDGGQAMDTKSMAVEPGQISIEAQVSIIYQLQ